MGEHDYSRIADRLEAFTIKANRVIDNRGKTMTAGGQATALAMLVTLDLHAFDDAVQALREAARQQEEG